MLNKLNDDILRILITYLDYFIDHYIHFIKHNLLNLDILCLKKTNKYMYYIIEEYYIKKYNYKTMYVIDNTITVHYKNIVNTVYFNEISKIGNIKMFNEIPKYSYTQYCDIINNAKENKRRICCVGTTAMRAIESSVSSQRTLNPFTGWTNKFIYPPYDFSLANAMVTNFHIPKSTLLMMISAFCGHDLMMKAYKEAIQEKYRFYSYGDAMLII